MLTMQNNGYSKRAGGLHYEKKQALKGGSRLMSLRDDFQKKILKEKEEKLIHQIENDNIRRQQTLQKYEYQGQIVEKRNDALSAPSVRQFFQERKKHHPSSAGQPQIPQTQPQMHKRHGIDKSRPLAPITHNPNGAKNRVRTDGPKKNVDNGFVKWRQEQDLLDKQRRLNGTRQRDVGTDLEIAETQIMMEAEERQRKTEIRERENERRQRQAEVGRRRREESERKRKVAAERKAREEALRLEQEEQEAAEAVDSEQAELLQRLEEQLETKKKDLNEIQKRKVDIRSDYEDRKQDSPPEYQPPFPVKPRRVTRSRKGSKPPPSQYERETTPETYALSVPEITKPAHTLSSPLKTQKNKPTALNSTYSVMSSPSTPGVTDQRRTPKHHSPPTPIVATPRHQGYSLPDQIEDDDGEVINLRPCANCGRKFNEERLTKHMKACKTASKTRKKFNVKQQRIDGTGAEGFQRSSKNKEKLQAKPKKNWRAQHKEFIESIRYAKKAAQIEAEGGNLADLPPPPKAENPDYVQCQHCGRKFNQTAAERHIPKCKDIKAKPTALARGAGASTRKPRK